MALKLKVGDTLTNMTADLTDKVEGPTMFDVSRAELIDVRLTFDRTRAQNGSYYPSGASLELEYEAGNNLIRERYKFAAVLTMEDIGRILATLLEAKDLRMVEISRDAPF